MGDPALQVVTIEDAAEMHDLDLDTMRQFVMDGDLSKIAEEKRPHLIMALCRHIGVDPIERPFLVFADGKKTVLYAARACTSALCRERGISRQIVSIQEVTMAGQSVIIARARATMPDGRFDESTGVVPVLQEDTQWKEGSDGKRRKTTIGWRDPTPHEAANLPMKAETKAKRRAVLDLVGLGMPDESEIETIRGARRGRVDMVTGDVVFEGAPAIAAAPAPARSREQVAADTLAELHVDIAGRVNDIAAIMRADKGNVYCGAVKAAGLPRDTPIESLDHMASVAVLERLYIKLAALRGEPLPESPGVPLDGVLACDDLYARLCDAAPADYEPNNWKREWANMLALDGWPEHPSATQYGELAEHLTRILEKIAP
jgi:hypothetical protein